MNRSSGPLVSIGLPVHNGEAHLRSALESLLNQSLADFELIVSDNASTDSTPEILQAYASRDPRIRVVRQKHDIGMTANFNFVANEASAKYFMWAAHDDEWAPTYVQRCVERLEEDPRYVLCASWVRFVGPREPSTPEIFHNLDIARPGPHALVAALSVPGWYALYGVIRRDALARTSLVKYIWGPDVALLFELAMLGDFAIVPEPLFYYRYRGYDAATELRLASLTSAPGVSDSRPDLYTSLLREIYRTLLSSSGPPWFRLSLAWTFTYHAFITSFNWQLLLQRDASRQLRAAVESRDIWGFVRALLKKLVFTPYAPHIVIPNVIRRVRRSLRRSR